MIDFHTHILPNIDDGSRNIDETVNLIKEAKEAGFEDIVLTSHYIEGHYETDEHEREVWLGAIKENLRNKSIDTNLYLGSEIFFSENMLKLLEDRRSSTINETSYVLFELPMSVEPLYLFDMVYELTKNNIVPVLAHPERYTYVQEDPNLVFDLIDRGVLMQANYGSILGIYGKKAELIVEKLLENNMIHFLGSDVHRQNSIYPKIPEAIMKITAIIGEERFDKIAEENPRKALNNKKIDSEEPTEIFLTLKEKLKMKLSKR